MQSTLNGYRWMVQTRRSRIKNLALASHWKESITNLIKLLLWPSHMTRLSLWGRVLISSSDLQAEYREQLLVAKKSNILVLHVYRNIWYFKKSKDTVQFWFIYSLIWEGWIQTLLAELFLYSCDAEFLI